MTNAKLLSADGTPVGGPGARTRATFLDWESDMDRLDVSRPDDSLGLCSAAKHDASSNNVSLSASILVSLGGRSRCINDNHSGHSTAMSRT